jgi:hypothetical protein
LRFDNINSFLPIEIAEKELIENGFTRQEGVDVDIYTIEMSSVVAYYEYQLNELQRIVWEFSYDESIGLESMLDKKGIVIMSNIDNIWQETFFARNTFTNDMYVGSLWKRASEKDTIVKLTHYVRKSGVLPQK